ncbi:MAG: mycothiol system anti-sigma-R factor [Micromonosporaceae bacterium]
MSCGEPHEVDCREILQDVYLYLDLECENQQRDRIRQHLDECAPCLREYGLEQEIKALVARCCQEVAPSGLRERVRVRLRQIVVEADTREFLAE